MIPNVTSMFDWLRRDAVTAGGVVLSWSNPAKPGYAYPEAGGLVLGVLCQEGAPFELEQDVARWLCGVVSESGGVGRGGIDYVFDTAVALRALLAFERAGGRLDERVLERMFGFIASSIERKSPVSGGATGDRWSNSWSPHLLKVVLAVHDWRQRTADARCNALEAHLVETLLPLTLRWIEEASAAVPHYVHALCYSAEALLELSKSGMSDARHGVNAAAECLAGLQVDGALPAWSGEGTEKRRASDATAQAVRLWSALDRAAHSNRIGAALAHLASVQHSSGGLLYAPEVPDVNTWCTVFAVQAVHWAERGANTPMI